MAVPVDMAKIAALIGDQVRANMLSALLGGDASSQPSLPMQPEWRRPLRSHVP
jgi:hypothetical protein